MSLLHITIYKTSIGKEPFTQWLLTLDTRVRAIVLARLKRVALYNFGDCKQLKGASGIWELRIQYGAGYRVYFGKQGITLVVLLLGGDKKSQNRDILRAQKYWSDYEEKNDNKKKK